MRVGGKFLNATYGRKLAFLRLVYSKYFFKKGSVVEDRKNVRFKEVIMSAKKCFSSHRKEHEHILVLTERELLVFASFSQIKH